MNFLKPQRLVSIFTISCMINVIASSLCIYIYIYVNNFILFQSMLSYVIYIYNSCHIEFRRRVPNDFTNNRTKVSYIYFPEFLSSSLRLTFTCSTTFPVYLQKYLSLYINISICIYHHHPSIGLFPHHGFHLSTYIFASTTHVSVWYV